MDTSHRIGNRRRPQGGGLADALGWFSIGLGVAEVLMPRLVARGVGMTGNHAVLRACGLREIATGIGILSSRDKSPWMWGRVGGDALDIAALGVLGHNRGRSTAMLGALAGVAALDYACARQLESAKHTPRGAVRDYSDRSGFPRPAAEMRGAARAARGNASQGPRAAEPQASKGAA
jgi:hypothetical protein